MNTQTVFTKPTYRVVLTCWDAGKKEPYTDSIESFFETFEEAHAAMKKAVKDELTTLNDREYDANEDVEYPSDFDRFRADFDSEKFDAIIRLWDGDDYWPVTGYKIHQVVPTGEHSCKYRSYGDRLNSGDNASEENAHCFYCICSGQIEHYMVLYKGEYIRINPSIHDALNFIDGYILEREESVSPLRVQRYKLTLCEGEPDEETVYAHLNPVQVATIRKDISGELHAAASVLLTDGRIIDTGIVDTLTVVETVPSDEDREWILPVTWEQCGLVKVKAATLEEAIEHFKFNSDLIDLPEDSDYVDGSFQLSSEELEYIGIFNKKK